MKMLHWESKRNLFLLSFVVIILLSSQGSLAHPLDEVRKLNEQAVQLYQQGHYREAISLAEQALAIGQKVVGMEDVVMAPILHNLAGFYKAVGDYSKAEALFKRALEIEEKAVGPNHPNVAQILDNLAVLYSELGDYSKAEPLSVRALATLEKTFGPNHPRVAACLNNLAEIYVGLEEYSKAETFHRRGLQTSEKTLGPDHPQVAMSLHNLAQVHLSLGEYSKAESYHKRALAIREKSLGRDHPTVGQSLNSLAGLYVDIGNYAMAESLQKEAVAIAEKKLGPSHRSVAAGLNNLAELYTTVGDYSKAESLYRRALEIYEKVLGLDHLEVATCLNNMALLYYTLGDYSRAEPLYGRALAIREKTLGADCPMVAQILQNLALSYGAVGDYSKAESFYRRALVIYEKAFGINHPVVATTLDNLAGLHLEAGRIEVACRMFKANDVPAGLGRCHLVNGNFDEAEKAFHRSLQVSLKKNETEFIIADHVGLGLASEAKGEFSKAKEYFKKAVDLIEGQWKTISPEAKKGFLVAKVAAGFSRLEAYEGLVRILLKEGQKDSLGEAFRVAERVKGRGLLEMLATREVRGRGNEDEAILRRDREYQQSLLSLRKQVDVMQGVKKGVSEGELRRLKEALNEKEKEYTTFIEEVKLKNSELSTLLTVDPPSLSKIQSLLDSDVTFLEYYTTKEKTYAWLLARNDIRVYEIALSEKDLKERVDRFLIPNISNRSRKAEPAMVFVPKDQKETRENEREENRKRFYQVAHDLYQAIVAPIEKDIKTPKLIIVPHGVLHKVPFSTLTDGQRYLVDKYAISVLPSASVIEFIVKKRKSEKEKLLAFANPQTDYVPLGFAEIEGKTLSNLFPGGEVYYREKATETLAKKRGSDFNIIHFASHGEFNERQPLQSGLLLAKDDENDGYLQVHEIFGMDLRNANLVTLSACETALSKIQGGDDLVGLSRGFIYAGTPSILATLWKVDDRSTSILMEIFYKNWQKGMSKPEALRQAQITLKAMPQYKHPFYWAPFVMIGDWR